MGVEGEACELLSANVATHCSTLQPTAAHEEEACEPLSQGSNMGQDSSLNLNSSLQGVSPVSASFDVSPILTRQPSTRCVCVCVCVFACVCVGVGQEICKCDFVVLSHCNTL